MKDLKNSISVVVALALADHAATKADSAIIDLQGARSATVVVSTGAITGAGQYVVSLVHGDAADLTESAEVAAPDLLGSFPAELAADSVYTVGYVGGKRYVRAVITKVSGTSVLAGAVLVKGHLNISPAA